MFVVGNLKSNTTEPIALSPIFFIIGLAAQFFSLRYPLQKDAAGRHDVCKLNLFKFLCFTDAFLF